MPGTPNFSLPYPLLTDSPNGPAQVQALATAVDTALLTEQTARQAVATDVANHGRGVVARQRRTTSGTATTATTAGAAQKLMELDVPVVAGRLYRASMVGVGVYSTNLGESNMQLTYTTDGSTPAATSTVLTTGQVQTPAGSLVIALTVGETWTATVTGTWKVLASYFVTGAAAGTNMASYGATTWPAELTIEDLGVDPGTSGTNF